jgi:hypothetical protein
MGQPSSAPPVAVAALSTTRSATSKRDGGRGFLASPALRLPSAQDLAMQASLATVWHRLPEYRHCRRDVGEPVGKRVRRCVVMRTSICGHKARIQTIALLVRALEERDAVRSQPGLQPRIVSLTNAVLLLVIFTLAPPTRTSRSQLQKWHTRLERWMRSFKRVCSVILYSPQLPDRQRVQQDGAWYCKGRDHDLGIGADLR